MRAYFFRMILYNVRKNNNWCKSRYYC